MLGQDKLIEIFMNYFNFKKNNVNRETLQTFQVKFQKCYHGTHQNTMHSKLF